MSRRAIAFVLLFATWPSAGLHAMPESSAPSFVPERALAGRSEGIGALRFLFGKESGYRVDNVGTPLADGTFQLEQTIRFEGKPPRMRRWILRDAGAGRYTFTLSDAAQPGEARVEGRTLLIEYRARDAGVDVQQRLTPADDGSIDNQGRICFLGIPVGWMRETITPLR